MIGEAGGATAELDALARSVAVAEPARDCLASRTPSAPAATANAAPTTPATMVALRLRGRAGGGLDASVCANTALLDSAVPGMRMLICSLVVGASAASGTFDGPNAGVATSA